MAEAVLSNARGGVTDDDSAETPTARALRRLLRRRGAVFGLFVIASGRGGVAGAADLALRSEPADLDRRAQGAVGVALVRHRRCRTRRAGARDLWRASLADGGHHLG